jgi:MarR family transcriptional regulator, transcriptional regulator for hemolysin
MAQRTPAATHLDALLAHRLAVAGRLVRSHADAELTHLGIGAPSLGVLLRLVEEDGLTQAELARRQRVEAPSICRMVDRLERDGLVERRADPGDRRATRVRLTPAGLEVADRGAEILAAIERTIGESLDEEEQRVLGALLSRVLDVLAPQGGAPS